MRPMTAPPRNATGNAAERPPFRAALAVLTLAFTAISNPMTPAKADKTVPKTYVMPIFTPRNNESAKAMTATNIPRYLYSVLMNALDPSWIHPAISFILSVPASMRLTYWKRKSPSPIEITDATGAINHGSNETNKITFNSRM